MKQKIFAAILLTAFFAAAVSADPLTESAQQKLKEQGFYYGAINGAKDADTVAAIRRYQIRTGLHISGELDADTQRSLGISGSGTATKPQPTPARTNTPRPQFSPPPPTVPRREDQFQQPPPRVAPPSSNGIFRDTPYEDAPPSLQRRIIAGAQAVLLRGGYYRGAIDGRYGTAMQFSLQAFQSRCHLAPSGALDQSTLDALGLLPGQRGSRVPVYRSRPHWEYAPDGERIYLPN